MTSTNHRIAELEAKVQDLELNREIDAAGAVDKETVMLYAVEALERGSDDIPAVIRELKKAKPFLFTTTRAVRPSTHTDTMKYLRARGGR